jgi:CRISPR-associated protein Cas2
MAYPGKYVIVYDMTANRERHRVSRVLEGFGFRIQKSAFECLLSTRLRAKLRRRLEGLQLSTGFIYMYRVNENAKRIEIGRCPATPFDDSHYAYVICGPSPQKSAHPETPQKTASSLVAAGGVPENALITHCAEGGLIS